MMFWYWRYVSLSTDKFFVHKKNSTVDILLGNIQKVSRELFFAQTDKRCFRKRSFVRKNVMKWQKNGAIKNVRHSGKREERLTEKVTKSDVGERVAAKKSDVTHSKKRDFANEVLFEWPLWCWLILLYFLWVYLLVMLLVFYEANKPYISK